MFSDAKILLCVSLLLLDGCSSLKRLNDVRTGAVSLALTVPAEVPSSRTVDEIPEMDNIEADAADGPVLMNAIRDSETGEMVATDFIKASTVTARFRNVAERQGLVTIEFDISVPEEMSASKWQLKIFPHLYTEPQEQILEPLYITGTSYRQAQLRGYQRYRKFLNSIVTDTTDLLKVRQLEIFIRRNYPETYAMKTDSSIVSEPLAEDVFGVSQAEALRHYTRHMKVRMNERRKSMKQEMFDRYVKDPIPDGGVRLDTVMQSSDGVFTYRYSHTFRCRPKLRKAVVRLSGDIYEDGSRIAGVPFGDSLTYYISSLSSLADNREKFKVTVQERTVYDNTKALLDFRQGSCELDSLMGDNASELLRVRRCLDDVKSRTDLCLDSLFVIASCSPEGLYRTNERLSEERAAAVRRYIGEYVPEEWGQLIRTDGYPENWEQFGRLVKADTLLSASERNVILSIVSSESNPDIRESKLSRLPRYRYLREKIYPRLRYVEFRFYLHRCGMERDTLILKEPDTEYMSGLAALEALDYKEAVRILKPYGDYNSALALASAGYNYTALDVLEHLNEENAKTCYLKSLIYSRTENESESAQWLEKSISYDRAMSFRANLDPELHDIIYKYNINQRFNYE